MKKLLFVLLILSVVTSYTQIPSYVPTNGLVGYWPFNGNANDVSGNGNNGTLNGATLTTDRFGNVGKAYSFNGSSAIQCSIPTNYSPSSTGNYSFSFWFNINTNPSDTRFLMAYNTPNNASNYDISSYHASCPTNTIAFQNYPYNNPSACSPNLINLHEWVYLTLVFESSNQICKVYKNGVFWYSGNISINSPAAGNLCFGNNTTGGPFGFNGSLDDIAIYNRALSQSEITGLYNAGTNTCLPSYLPTTGLVGYWPFCGNANDESGNGNNGTVNGATLTTDRFGNVGKAYDFNGVNSYIQVPDNNSLDINGNITISAWFKTNTLTSSRIIDKTTVGSVDAYTLDMVGFGNPVDRLRFIVANNIHNPTPQDSLRVNRYYHAVVTYDQTNVKLFLDGTLINTVPRTGFSSINNNPLRFGANSLLNGNWFNGVIDDIAIYNRALSSTEIQNLFNASAPTPCIANINNNDTTICKGQSLTLNASAVATGSVTDINGNVYPTVNIGSQTWMQKNLNVSKYKNGDIIPQVTNPTQWAALTTGAWCWYNNDSLNYSKYGKLYNWYAVNDPRGLAPNGWHVPSDGEWNKLVKYLDNSADTTCSTCVQSLVVGGALKDTGVLLWANPNVGATNATFFKGLPAGYRDPGGNFVYNKTDAIFWTSTENSIVDAYYRYFISATTNFYKGFNGYFNDQHKTDGFSIRCINNTPNTSTYLWSTGATTPSITVSPLVTTTYYCTVSDGVNTCRDSVKITVGATAVPSAPSAITGATDVCSFIGADTASVAVNYKCNKVSTASSYLWTVPAGVTLLSGQGDTSINVRFSASFVSGAITVKSINVCGTSTSARSLTVYKRVAATPAAIQKQFTPTSIVAVTNVTGLVSETYRIKKVLYATSYNWSMNRGTNATITHINPLGVNDTAVIVTFFNCFVRDTLSVKAVTPCSVSTAKTAILIANTAAASVAGIGTAGGDFSVCIGSSKTFNAIAGTPTSAQAPIASFRWTKPTNAVITSATSDSSSITVSFNAGFTGGSLTAKGVTACGVISTTAATAILQYLPPTPLSISSSTNSYNACINSTVTYTAIVGAPTTSQAPASVFRWTRPNNTSITSASADSSSITVRFNTGYVGGTLSVRGQSRCGAQGNARSQSLTHTGCAAGTKMSLPVTAEKNSNTFDLSLYPNPSAGEFKLMINAPFYKSKATVKVIDLQGRLMKSFECNANQVTAIGNELKPGVYMVEVIMGNEVKTVRAVRF